MLLDIDCFSHVGGNVGRESGERLWAIGLQVLAVTIGLQLLAVTMVKDRLAPGQTARL